MKLSIFSILLLTGIIAITSCTSTSPKEELAEKYTIDTNLLKPAATAKADMAYFDTLCATYLTFPPVHGNSIPASEIPIKGFTVRAEDLFAAMGVSGHVPHTYDNIRVYIGYNQEQNKFKLYIVPVADANITDTVSGADVLLDHNGDPVPTPPGPLTDRYVLDLNAPCPSLCDVSSPLMEATGRQ